MFLFSNLGFAQAQNFTIDWWTIDSGGGTSTAGVYTVTGTLGQRDVGRLNSADFTIDGGFWSIVATIQTPGAPLLSVRLTQTNTVLVSWPITWPGFQLQENLDPTTTNWVTVATQPIIVIVSPNQAMKEVMVGPTRPGKQFYRLNGP